MLTKEQYQEFLSLADAEEGLRERECTPYLEHAINWLLPQTPIENFEIGLEQRSPYGRSDFIVSARLKEEHGPINRYIYFWELKAPQCVLMQSDGAASRFRPTNDLVKAETQLIHYVHQARTDRDFHARYDVRYPENIRMGGIIIGRDHRIAAAQADQEAAHHSLRVRIQSIYEFCKIRIMTWDRILEVTKPAE